MILSSLGVISVSRFSYDIDALNVINAIEGTGVTLTATQKDACNTLIVSLKNYGIWTKIKASFGFLGGTAAAHKFNWKDPRDLDTAFRLAFNGGWTHSSTGALPNGTNAYADTYLGANLLQNNNHLSYYSRTTAVNVECELGVYNNLPSGILNQLRVAGNYVSGQAGNSGSTVNFTTTNDAKGFWIGTKRSNNDKEIYLNGYSQNTNLLTDNSILPSINVFLGARNKGGTSAELFSKKELAFASIGDGLTDTEAANLYTAVQAYQTTLGRQF